jgi:hypothetical protein
MEIENGEYYILKSISHGISALMPPYQPKRRGL